VNAVEVSVDLLARILRQAGCLSEHSVRPFFIATQFHPVFKSRSNDPHPLFIGFVKEALEYMPTKTRAKTKAA